MPLKLGKRSRTESGRNKMAGIPSRRTVTLNRFFEVIENRFMGLSQVDHATGC
jgi:hypothetical protein